MSDEGWSGSGERADCRVRVAPADAVSIRVECGQPRLLEAGIRAVVEEVLAAHGGAPLEVTVEDHGALDYVLRARLEAALRRAGMEPGLPVVVSRPPADVDRPRRSRLYAPGNTPRLLAGVELHGADCVVLDLEDAVPPTEKLAARILVKHLLVAVPFPGEVWVRINPLEDGGLHDLRELIPARPHGFCLPKAESAAQIEAASEAIAETEAASGLEPGTILLMPILETARGILHSEAIADAGSRIACLAFGAEDYLRDTGASRGRDALLWARSRVVAAARAAGVQASDTVYAGVEDDVGLEDEARHARGLGFDGKGAIHPRQVAILHRAFAPSPEEIAHARRVVAAAEAAEAEGRGSIAVNGRMVDRPVLERARRLLRAVERTGEEGAR
jgi:citrate lyase subunit beta/citryl-CoA lyase